MIYDCFTFFNELDLLEIRLNELNDVVDKFVIVECTKTHSYKDKPLYYDKNKDRYAKFHDKIIHIVVDDAPDITKGIKNPDRWIIEKFQRSCIGRALNDCKGDDIILVSDVDEIPSVSGITTLVEILPKYIQSGKGTIITFYQDLFYYFLNGLCCTPPEPDDPSSDEPIPITLEDRSKWLGTVGCYYRDFPGAEAARMTRGSNNGLMENGGWHFSYLGGVDNIIKKLESFAHTEFDTEIFRDKDRILNNISEGDDLFDRPDKPRIFYIPMNTNFAFPSYLKDNLEKFQHLINSSSS